MIFELSVAIGDCHLYRRGKAARSLLFVQIFAGNVVLRRLMRANFLTLSIPSVFHAHHYVGLERVPFPEQFVHAFRICAFNVGQSLQISRLPARTRYRSLW
jgi:hypothetical protein